MNQMNENEISIRQKIKRFCSEHKSVVVIAKNICIGIGFFVLGYYAKEHFDSITITNLENENDFLRKHNKDILESFGECANTLSDLEKRCYLKDKIMCTTAADGLRHGSSECGRQLAYKRWS